MWSPYWLSERLASRCLTGFGVAQVLTMGATGTGLDADRSGERWAPRLVGSSCCGARIYNERRLERVADELL